MGLIFFLSSVPRGPQSPYQGDGPGPWAGAHGIWPTCHAARGPGHDPGLDRSKNAK